ncbi:hypothetical protein Leryth_022569 [Lithospermum erythrorhizon]|nr:hypothetical protein Leryth_022569 [Lithospermum erythrorhizon]
MDINQIDIDVDAPLSVSFSFHKKRKLQQCSKHKKLQQTKPKRNGQDANSIVALDDTEPFGDIGGERLQHRGDGDISSPPEASPQDSIPLPLEEEKDATEGPPGISVSFFDHSVENHLKSLRTMFKLCGEHDTPDFNQAEIKHLSSITFLKEWRDFNYKPKTIRFACQNESMNSKNVIGEISLPQFSSVAVPEDLHNEKSISSQPSKDFVLYAGGSVWALDWCPRANKPSVSGMKMEFVAVAAHPPGSSYHKIGSALTGRGAVQIWCILDVSSEESNSSQDKKKQKRCYRKPQTDNSNSAAPKRPRGRPRKHKTNDTSDNMKSGSQVVDPPTTECPKDSSSLVPIEIASKDTYEGDSLKKCEDVPAHVQKKQNCVDKKGQIDDLNSSAAAKTRGRPRRKARNEAPDNVNNGSPLVDPHAIQYPGIVSSSLTINVSPICNDEVIDAESEIAPSQVEKHQKGIDRKSKTESTKPHRTKERWKKKSGNDSSNDIERSRRCIQPLEFGTIPVGGVGSENVTEADSRNNPPLTDKHTECKLFPNTLKHKVEARIGERGHVHNLVQDGTRELPPLHSKSNPSCFPDSIRSSGNVNSISCRDVNTLSNYTPTDHVPLPKMMLCLAHNGKVVWDLKWRPADSHDKLRLGYLAVVLGSGSIEVWEVPCPYAVQVIYNSSSQLECSDPRFIKLQPVFRCSKLNSGDRQSIPLTVGWSASSPHDIVIAGCHDGLVALWKFSAAVSCEGMCYPEVCHIRLSLVLVLEM